MLLIHLYHQFQLHNYKQNLNFLFIGQFLLLIHFITKCLFYIYLTGHSCETTLLPVDCDEESYEAFGLEMYQRCKKRQFHDKYIPIGEFTEANLPDPVGCPWLVDFIRWRAKHTVYIRVHHCATERLPQYRLGEPTSHHSHTGTGNVQKIDMSDPRQVEWC